MELIVRQEIYRNSVVGSFGGWWRAWGVVCRQRLGWWADTFHRGALGCRYTLPPLSNRDARTSHRMNWLRWPCAHQAARRQSSWYLHCSPYRCKSERSDWHPRPTLQVESGEGSRFVRSNSAHSTLRYFVPIKPQTSNFWLLISHL